MIVVAGEALVDLICPASARPGQLDPLVPRPGGGPYNTAIALGRLGVPVAFLSRISTDVFGEALVERLRSATVDTRWVQRGPEPTTLAVVALRADGSAGYAFHTHGTADRLVRDPGPLPDEVTALSVGTLSLVLEPGAGVYEKVLRREAAAGRLTVLDPNVRPVLIEDPDAYRARFFSWLPDVGLVKASVEDARWLAGLGADADVEPVAREWLRAGATAVVLTRGADGLTAFTERAGPIDVPAIPARVVDTIGAGDTVHAALLAWLHRHRSWSSDHLRGLDAAAWRAALRFAAAAAAVTVSRAGAESPYAADLHAYHGRDGWPPG